MGSLLQKTCLKPSYSLRSQLFVSFGSSAFVTLLFIVLFASLAALFAGRAVKDRYESLAREQMIENLVEISEVGAETFTGYIDNMEGSVQILAEAVRERFVGYPDDPGFAEDRYVPFVDETTGQNKYPLKSPPLPLEWQSDLNINEDNAVEHVQERAPWVKYFPASSSPNWFVQGICDPSHDNQASPFYYPNCTDANNNMETGGAVAPTKTAKWLYEKSADLAVFLKPVFEAQFDALRASFYFFNEGAGASVNYPGLVTDGTGVPYVSDGCEWLRETNPHTGRPFGTQDQIDRCHPKGTMVPQREYNNVERPWFAEVVRHSEAVRWTGPLAAASGGLPLISVSRAVFDRRTGELIGCATVDIAVSDLNLDMKVSRLHDESELAIARLDTGNLIADSMDLHLLEAHAPGLAINIPVVETPYVDEESFQYFKTAVDFSKKWSPVEVKAAYEREWKSDLGTVVAQPLPYPPVAYNSSYRPQYLVFHAMRDEVFAEVRAIDDEVDNEVAKMILTSFLLAIAGMGLILLIIWGVSRMLTQPLMWIDNVAFRIINHAESDSGDSGLDISDKDELAATVKCAPRTEINTLVAEFRTMINSFSGGGSSKVAQADYHEVYNEITWQSDFRRLYSQVSKQQRKQSVLMASGDTVPSGEGTASEPSSEARGRGDSSGFVIEEEDHVVQTSIVPAPVKQNKGSNIAPASSSGPEKMQAKDKIRMYRSPLFWWTLLLIALPVFLTVLIISWFLIENVDDELSSLVERAGDLSFYLEVDALVSLTRQKAQSIQMLMTEPVRNLYLMTRIAGWLLFGGITRSDSFTSVDTYAEECKSTPRDGTCLLPYANRTACSCDWEDAASANCTNFSDAADTRYLQHRFYTIQARDFDNVTGARVEAASFPKFDNSPETTLWWDDSSRMPGSQQGANASGFGTTYSRLRGSAPLSIIEFPMYNFARMIGRQSSYIGTYVGFEADGAFTGFSGCDHQQAYASYWNSTEDNFAAVIAPKLCPLGKFGYDPRCRDWYAAGHTRALEFGEHVHITAPYEFALSLVEGTQTVVLAASATAAIINPVTGEYAGQTLFDFFPSGIRTAMERLNERLNVPLSIVITPEEDVWGADTVYVGPSDSEVFTSSPVVDEMFLENDTENRQTFEETILKKMKAGEWSVVSNNLVDSSTFKRLKTDGSTEELTMIYFPVWARVLHPVQPDDVSRGAYNTSKLVYSVGIAWDRNVLQAPSIDTQDDINEDLDQIWIVYGTLASVFTILFGLFAAVITIYITKPMIRLLRVVRMINNGTDGNIPPMKGGSREVNQVYSSLAKLCRILRVSNTAFFSGNLQWACHFISDALQLFRKVEDEKAIGVACNNLGNTLFAMTREMDERYLDATTDNESIALIDGVKVPEAALQHFDEAVQMAQHDFEEASLEELKADFAVQLADRLFNRALFLLFIQHGENAPERAREQAFHDIALTRDLDYDVKEFWLERKLLLKKSAEYFARLLRRVNGLVQNYDDEDLREIWPVAELIEDADRVLFAAWDTNAPLFDDVSRVGRRQELESMAIRHELCRNNNIEAARFAMRMFAEDEFILECPFYLAATALLSVLRGNEAIPWSSKTSSLLRADLRKMLKSCKNATLDIGKSLVIALELSDRWEDDPMLEKIHQGCMMLYNDSCTADDFFGLVAQSKAGEVTTDIGRKADNEGRQISMLEMATESTSERAFPAFPMAVQMVVDSAVSTDNDSYIVLLADGFSWDSEVYLSIKEQIERLNRERNTSIHVVILGVDVESDEIIEQCKLVCTASKASMYVDVTPENVDATFDSVAALITARRSLPSCPLIGTTMEKF